METSTQELPLTSAVRQVVRAEAARRQRTLLWIGAGLAGFFLLLGLGLDALGVMAVVAAGTAALFFGVAWWAGGKARLALAQGSLVRTAGPIGVGVRGSKQDSDEESSAPAVHLLQLSDRTMPIPTGLAQKLEGLTSATVEYAKHLDLVLEVRDPGDQLVYRDPRYRP